MTGRCSTAKVDLGLLTANFPLFMNKQRRLLCALFAGGVRRGNYRTDKVDRISLCECDNRADGPIGLKADNSSAGGGRRDGGEQRCAVVG